MKRFTLFLALAVLAIGTASSQSETQSTAPINTEEIKEQRKVIRKVEKQEKVVAKAEKAYKKTEKKQKKEAKLAKAIQTKMKSISKSQKKITSIQQKLKNGEANGKLSPVEIEKMHTKLDTLKARITKDKEKLAKLMKKQ